MKECLQTWAAAGPCATCGELQLEGVHVVEIAIYCAGCCPRCGRQGSMEWETDAAVTIGGEQEKLF